MNAQLYRNLMRVYGQAFADARLGEENRRGYIAQSAATRDGVVAPFPHPAGRAAPSPAGSSAGSFLPHQPEQPA